MVDHGADGFNAINRGVYIADNLDFLRALNTETVDLIYIDPPFAKNETWEANRLRPPLTEEERAIERRLLNHWGITNETQAQALGVEWPDDRTGFSDIWTWAENVHEEWLLSLDEDYPSVKELIEAAEAAHGESMAAYLCYMAVRLIELERVLKPTGSMYLHCDPTASHYLKGLMDAIFGAQNFRNEIIWRIGWVSGFKTQKRGWIRNHDTILYYVASPAAVDRFNKEYLPYPEGYVRRDGKPPTGKGFPIEDTWNSSVGDVLDSIMIKSFSTEKTGYPTQKPIALLERIVQASSNEGEVVLDCFAGCATASLAAERLNRRWVACDFNPRAWTVLKRRFNQPPVTLRCTDETTGQQVMGTEPVVTVHGPNELPVRTSPETAAPAPFTAPEREFKVPASIIPQREMLEVLLEMSGYQAWCCGFANRRPDGTIVRTTNNFHLDHIDPRSRQGSNQITNRAPLCPTHNVRKGNRPIGLREYREEIAEMGELLVDGIGDLISLSQAYQQALDYYSEARLKRGNQSAV